MKVVYILDEFVSCPLCFTIGEDEMTNRMAIEENFVPLNHWVMAVNSHSRVIVRDGKGKDFAIKFIFALNKPKKDDKSP